MKTQWYLDSEEDGAKGAAVKVASANHTPDFRAKAPDAPTKAVEHKKYREKTTGLLLTFECGIASRFAYKKHSRHNHMKGAGRIIGVELAAVHWYFAVDK